MESFHVDIHPKKAGPKTLLSRAKSGFDFLGFRITPTHIQQSAQSVSCRDNNIARLYEQGANKKRIGQYLKQWLGWSAVLLGCLSPIHYSYAESTGFTGAPEMCEPGYGDTGNVDHLGYNVDNATKFVSRFYAHAGHSYSQRSIEKVSSNLKLTIHNRLSNIHHYHSFAIGSNPLDFINSGTPAPIANDYSEVISWQNITYILFENYPKKKWCGYRVVPRGDGLRFHILKSELNTGTVFTLTLDPNNGNSNTTSFGGGSVYQGEDVWLPYSNNGLTRAGYTFEGWYSNASGTGGTSYAANSLFTMSNVDTILYAKWKGINQTLSYNGNGNTVGTVIADASIPTGDTVTVAGKGTLVRDGYNFDGWNTKVDGTGVDYAASDTFDMTVGGVTLYAKWSAKNNTVTFDLQGHGSAIATQDVVSGNKVTMPTAPSETGFTFDGWYTDATMTTAYDFNTVVNGDITLYAKWSGKNNTVTFDLQGHGSAIATQDVVSGNQVTMPTAPSETGFTFDGWYTDATMTTAYDFNTVVNGDITLYAKWTATGTNPPPTTNTTSSIPSLTSLALLALISILGSFAFIGRERFIK